jgi:hypothetical protein
MSKEEIIQRPKIIIATKCLNYLPKPLRNIVGGYLQYEEAVKMKPFLRIDNPTKPLLHIEDMARNIRFFPVDQPNAETVYVPFVKNWALTVEMLETLMNLGIVKQVIWECPNCREWKPLFAYFSKGPRMIGYETHFGAGSTCFSACEADAEHLRDRHLEIAFEDGKRAPKITIEQAGYRFDEHGMDACLNNTYVDSAVGEIRNSMQRNYNPLLMFSNINDKEYINREKIRIKKEISKVGAKPLLEMRFYINGSTTTIKSDDGKSLDVDKVINDVIKSHIG